MKNYINKIIFNKTADEPPVYYVVKAVDGNMIRIEQLKRLPDGAEVINLADLRKKHIGIAYYSKYEETEEYENAWQL